MDMIQHIVSSRIVGQGILWAEMVFLAHNICKISDESTCVHARRTLKGLVADLKFFYSLYDMPFSE